MEPKGSLTFSQHPATYLRPEPVEATSRTLNYYSDSHEYYYPILAYVFTVVSIPQISPPKLCMHFSSPPHV